MINNLIGIFEKDGFQVQADISNSINNVVDQVGNKVADAAIDVAVDVALKAAPHVLSYAGDMIIDASCNVVSSCA